MNPDFQQKIERITPAIHMNGSGYDNLMAGLRAQWEAIDGAIKTMAANGPHMRDFYVFVDGVSRFNAANDAHVARMSTLVVAKDEIMAIIDNLNSHA